MRTKRARDKVLALVPVAAHRVRALVENLQFHFAKPIGRQRPIQINPVLNAYYLHHTCM